MAKVEEELSTADQSGGADDADALARTTGAPVPAPKQGHFLLRFWQSAVGKKWLMALSGIVLLGFVLVHMIGNLKVFLGKDHINTYGEWLRTLGEPALPRTVLLWIVRLVLIGAFSLTAGSFLLELEMTRSMRENLASKLTWLEKKQKEPGIADLRKDARIIPAVPHSTLTLADGTTHGCFVIDMSASGAAS